jgi:ribosomal protein S18 acetylase RimI-like enzyme
MTDTLSTGIPAVPRGGIRLRPWRGLEDIPGMAAANQRLRDRAGVLEPIDVERMTHRYTHLVNSDPRLDCLVAERDGSAVGYVRTEWHDLADGDRILDITLLAEPSTWGTGASEAMLDWAEAHLREQAPRIPGDRRTWLQSSVFGGDEGVTRALESRGFVPVRWGAEMLRPDLESIEDVPLAEGYALRSPTEAELPAVFAMVVEAFAEHWGESEAGEQRIEEWTDDSAFRLDLVVVAWKGDEPAAAVTNLLEELDGGSIRGLLDSVATGVRHRRLGLARATITESLRRLRAVGATSAYLGVDTGNHNRALTLYESCGFRVVSRDTSYRKPYQPDPGGDR